MEIISASELIDMLIKQRYENLKKRVIKVVITIMLV
jgi:hypothetical protein